MSSHKKTARKLIYIFIGILALVFYYSLASARFSSGIGDELTGAPGETDCTGCHSGPGGDGTIAILGLPEYYHSLVTYTITVQVSETGQSRWGFELTAIDNNGDGVGAFTITDAVNTTLSDNPAPGRDYVKHTADGTYAGTSDGPVEWQFQWTAPEDAVGDITFYAAGLAADNNQSITGDNTYLTSAAINIKPVSTGNHYGLAILIILLLISAIYVLIRRGQTAGTA
jgi:hypothetical protein